MKSWKARLLVVLTMLTMLLAVSVPAMADHLDPRFDPRFDPRSADDRVIEEAGDCYIVGENDVKERDGRPVEVFDPKFALCPIYDAEGNVVDWKRFRL